MALTPLRSPSILVPEQTSDLCFTAVAAAPVSSCQYTMVPLQGLALVGHCPLDGHMAAPAPPPPPHAVYLANGECIANGKAHRLPGLPRVRNQTINPSVFTVFPSCHRLLRVCRGRRRSTRRRRATVNWSATRCCRRRRSMATRRCSTPPPAGEFDTSTSAVDQVRCLILFLGSSPEWL